MPGSEETDPQALEQRLLKKRKQGRIRAQRFRERAEERADAKIAQALTRRLARPNISVPTQESSIADRAVTALLEDSCERYGVVVDEMVRPVGQGLHAQRVRKIGRKTALVEDFQTQLRASEQARTLLESIGKVPSRRHAEPTPPIVVNILMMPDKTDGTDSESAGKDKDV